MTKFEASNSPTKSLASGVRNILKGRGATDAEIDARVAQRTKAQAAPKPRPPGDP